MNFHRLILVLLSTTFLVLLSSPTADAIYYCGSTGNYSANSTYGSNLQILFKNLTTSATSSTSNFGFAKSTIGSIPNEIFGLVLCRGDVNLSDCSSCISEAIQDVQNLCPYNKESYLYYDYCLLRFTNQDFLVSTENSEVIYMYNPNNASMSIVHFRNLVNYLLNSTADYAAFNNTKKIGTSVMNLTDPFPVIRGYAQCTPDMSGSTCRACLQDLFNQVPNYLSGRQGGRFVGVRCNFRYESYPFYEGAALLTVVPPGEFALAPAPPTVTPPIVMNSGPHDLEKVPMLSMNSCTHGPIQFVTFIAPVVRFQRECPTICWKVVGFYSGVLTVAAMNTGMINDTTRIRNRVRLCSAMFGFGL